MNIDLIKQFAVNNNYYTFKINDFILPSYINNDKGIKLFIKSVRQTELLSIDSKYVKAFKEDIKELGITEIVIEEFPIIVDWNLWYKMEMKISENRPPYYFLLDFYIPKLRLCIEIDSEYHDDRIIYDRCRDLYLKSKYNIDTVRFYKYGNSSINRKKKKNELFSIINNQRNLYKNFGSNIFDYSEIIANNYIMDNQKYLNLIDRIISYSGINPIIDKNIILTMKDMKSIDSEIFGNCFTTNIDRLNMIDDLNYIMKPIYGISLITYPSEQYTFNEVSWLMSLETDISQLSILNNIPSWAITVFEGKVKKSLLQNLSINYDNKDDCNIKEFINLIKNLRSRKT